jgi:hypothetical protein
MPRELWDLYYTNESATATQMCQKRHLKRDTHPLALRNIFASLFFAGAMRDSLSAGRFSAASLPFFGAEKLIF